MSVVVMDTNVAVVANGRETHADTGCIRACITTLRDLREHHQLLLDEIGLIIREYRGRLLPSGQPGPGDAFFKWLWDNQGNVTHCRQIVVTPTADGRDFEEFPDDPDLASFDRDDRKFVAVAIASGVCPPILNASDTDWWHHRKALLRNGVTVQFLCRELMRRNR